MCGRFLTNYEVTHGYILEIESPIEDYVVSVCDSCGQKELGGAE